MQAFLATIKGTTHGPILAKIDQFLKSELVTYDDYVRQEKNHIQKMADEHRAQEEECIVDAFNELSATLTDVIEYVSKFIFFSGFCFVLLTSS